MIKRKILNIFSALVIVTMVGTISVGAMQLPSVSENAMEKNEQDTETDIEPIVETTMEIDLAEESDEGIRGFVTRMYNVCLDREPDQEGLDYWMGLLKTGKINGIQTAYYFVFSKEFQSKNLCNEDYLKCLYRSFMGREYDQEGLNYWLGVMNSGSKREAVFNGFATSKEFGGLCESYGIEKGSAVDVPEHGTVPKGNCSVCGKQDGVTAFVTRLYNVCLDRQPEQEGLDYWRNLLWTHQKTGADICGYFIFSKEFTAKNLNDEQFVEYLYRAFFDREYDQEGKDYWLSKMYYEGMNRSHVFAYFVNSKEFNNLCKYYGITLGTYTPVDDELTPDYVARMSYAAREKLIMGEYYGQSTLTKAQADSRMTVITVPVWDFLNTRSMTKVSKTATLTCNKGVAEYFKKAFEELYNHPSQPVIHPGSFYAYSYRANVNNPSVLSNHSYGTAIDINPGENPNGKAMVTAAAWAAMPQGSVNEMQKKAYTIYEGSPYYEVLYKKYHLYWLGYNRTVDAMHFEF